MLVLALLIAASKAVLTSPIKPSDVAHDVGSTTLTILGREVTDCDGTRSLWEIIWSCFSTIFACTWVAVHPNVPDSHHSGFWRLIQQAFTMVYAVLAPECMTMWALRQRMGAAKHMKDYNDRFHKEATRRDSSILNKIMTWFRGAKDKEPDVMWTLSHGFLLEMHGLIQDSGGSIDDVQDIPEDGLDIPKEEIDDKSKGDLLSKSLTVFQTAWFIFQCVTRWTSHLPVTELEVVTLAYAFLNIVTYALWWDKPLKMDRAIRMGQYKMSERLSDISEGKGRQEMRSGAGVEAQRSGGRVRPAKVPFMASFKRAFASLHPRNFRLHKIFDFILIPVDPVLEMMTNNDSDTARIFYSSWNAVEDRKTVLFFCVISFIFGALHLIPLATSTFPSSLERSLWKWSAIGITAEPIMWFCLRGFADLNFERMQIGFLSGLGVFVFFVILIGSVWVAAVARLVIIVIAFTTLRDLPSGAYQTIKWTAFIPHFRSAAP